VVDPQADAADAKHEYGINLVELDSVKDVDCLVFTVAHDEFRNMSWEQIDRLFGDFDSREKVIVDVKSILNKAELEKREYSYWRL